MSARDELADLLDRFHLPGPRRQATELLAAGYRKPRTITTAEELDALPWKSVVLDCDGDVWQRGGGRWRGTEGGRFMSSLLVEFAPFTVLHEPEPQS